MRLQMRMREFYGRLTGDSDVKAMRGGSVCKVKSEAVCVCRDGADGQGAEERAQSQQAAVSGDMKERATSTPEASGWWRAHCSA
jgi:hypothetical protein